MSDELLFTRKVAAQRLSISLSTIDALVSSGAIRCKRVGRKVLFAPGELEKFLRGGDVELPARKRKKKTQ